MIRFYRMIVLLILLLAATACSQSHPLPPEPLAESYIKPEIRLTRGKINDVYIDDKNVTQFSRPQHIYHASVYRPRTSTRIANALEPTVFPNSLVALA